MCVIEKLSFLFSHMLFPVLCLSNGIEGHEQRETKIENTKKNSMAD